MFVFSGPASAGILARGSATVIDVSKHVRYWRDGAEDDLESAHVLVSAGKHRQGLFFAHLALEKTLKALVCTVLKQVPPRTHDLVRLAREAGLSVSTGQTSVLKLTMRYCLEGRYPETWPEPPDRDEADRTLKDVHEVMQWLFSQL